MKKILIATDGSPASQEAVEFGVELAAEQDAAVVFVHVVPLTDRVPMSAFGMIGAVPHEPSEHDREALEEAEALAAQHGVRATTKLLRGDTDVEIVAYADNSAVMEGAVAAPFYPDAGGRYATHSARPARPQTADASTSFFACFTVAAWPLASSRE